MRKPLNITLVPARSRPQQTATATDSSSTRPFWAFSSRSMHRMELPATTKIILIDTGQGEFGIGERMLAKMMQQAKKDAATQAYHKRVKQGRYKVKPVVSNSYQNILAGGKFSGLVNGEPETFSLPGVATRRTRRATSTAETQLMQEYE